MLVGFLQPVPGFGVNFPPKPTDAVRARGEGTDAGETANTSELQIGGKTEEGGDFSKGVWLLGRGAETRSQTQAFAFRDLSRHPFLLVLHRC